METIDYKKIFEKSNKKIINRAKTINVVMGFVVIFLLPVLIFGIALPIDFGGYANTIEILTTDTNTAYFILYLFLAFCMVMYFIFACDYTKRLYTKELEKRTKSFALKDYLDDMIIVMKSKWYISKKTQNQIREIINTYSHLNLKTFSFKPDGVVLDEIDEDPIVIKQNEYIYYITEWRYTPEKGFLFTFDICDPAGITEKGRKTYLPSGKPEEIIP